MSDMNDDLFLDAPEHERPGARRPVIDPPTDTNVSPARRATDHELRGAYRVLREQFRRRCMAASTPCHFCDLPVDWSLPHPHLGSFEVHQTLPVARTSTSLRLFRGGFHGPVRKFVNSQ